MRQGKIIVVDDNQSVRTAVKLLLNNRFEQIELLSSPVSLLSSIREIKPDIVLLDMNFRQGINDGNEGLYWLSEIKSHYPQLPVVLFTAYADIELAVEALKRGATDFVVKPWDNTRLLNTLKSAIEMAWEDRKKNKVAPKNNAPAEIFMGESPAMKKLFNMAMRVAVSDANILITGENGTGKEVVARYIHEQSRRKDSQLVTVDMGAITETLFESELFGHVKGAFTDAKSDRKGKFEEAHGGTLFLDEIGNLPLTLQAKLLVALQSRQVLRVGSNTTIAIDIRLITATNNNLYELTTHGAFREDLLYRINTIALEVPPLRKRVEDIVPMAQFFLDKYATKYEREDLKLSSAAKEELTSYHWPGNVRELQHTIEKAVILCTGNEIVAEDLMLQTDPAYYTKEDSVPECSLEEMECRMIKASIERNEGNLSKVSAELGITRPTLYSKIKKYNL
ncbi:sigma-54 dependent transcriptional regulator [Porphyromonas pogonae]|uniref:sigma-54-dependent transcriptional regulator n=1 Tax=Porphyromonas pogonae TaxID=867595 RepID=UPI002E78D573|nr:sigma-54 dependent transcriptional regulator [Porphyromonas pogonae]